jgi:N-acetylmuramoyl-L-alanine amidase
LLKRLQDDGYRAVIDHEGLNEIGLSNRAQIVNNYCSVFGKQNVVYVSLHNNASPPNDGKWHKAKGWSIFVAPTASANSKKLASYICQEIEKRDIKVRRPLPKQDWWEGKFTVLTRTLSPAVLSENLFMDNKEDCAYLLSEEGQANILEAHVLGIERYIDELVGITKNETVSD